jgi:SAM-dependent methyltransferase
MEVLVAAGAVRLAAAIRAAAALDIGTTLEPGPLPAGEVAHRLASDEIATTLLLRALASEGVLAEPSPGVFGLGTGGQALLPSARGGLREVILGWAVHPAVYRALERMDEGVRSGRAAFEHVHHTDFFGWLAAHPDEEALYQAAVGGHQRDEFEGYVDMVDLGDRAVIVDVGGGGGGFLEALLARWPHLRAELVELPTVAAAAHARLAAAGLDDRISVTAADCRTDPLPRADCYLFSTVIRYFADDVAVQVLENVRRSATDGALVVLSEMPIADGVARAPGAMKSLIEHALTGGRDRRIDEFAALFDSAGFDLLDARVVHDPLWVIVGGRR